MTTTVDGSTASAVTRPSSARRRSTHRSPGSARGRSAPLTFLRRLVSPIILIALWQAASSAGLLSADTMASPATIAATARDLIADGTLGQEALISVQRVAIGLTLGLVTGLVLALLAGLSRLLDDAIDPPMQALRTLPHLGLVPLFIIWFGVGEEPKVYLVAFGVLFPIYLTTLAGIRGIDRRILEAADAMALTWWQRVRYVVLPGALPSALTGLRQSLGIAWLSLVVAETIAASSGLGYLINQAREFGQTDIVVVVLVVYAVLGLVTDGVVRIIERRALAWRS